MNRKTTSGRNKMPSRKKTKMKGQQGNGRQKKNIIYLLENVKTDEILQGIRDGKPAEVMLLSSAEPRRRDFDDAEIMRAVLDNLKRCEESIASVFNGPDPRH